MKITLLSDERIRLEPTPGPLTVEAPSAEMSYSPYHMLASALATCEHGVLASWADHAGIRSDDLVIEVGWSFAEKPHRVGRMELDLLWPSLPDERRAAAVRAAALCPVHRTLHTAPEIVTEVRSDTAP